MISITHFGDRIDTLDRMLSSHCSVPGIDEVLSFSFPSRVQTNRDDCKETGM
jgi:hypothetical protein